MKQKFIESGYEVVDFEEKADIYVVNTCTVTNMADRKSRQILRRAKQINPDSILVGVGCYVQVGKEEFVKIQDVDLILGNDEKNDIVKYIEEFEQKNPGQRDVSLVRICRTKRNVPIVRGRSISPRSFRYC